MRLPVPVNRHRHPHGGRQRVSTWIVRLTFGLRAGHELGLPASNTQLRPTTAVVTVPKRSVALFDDCRRAGQRLPELVLAAEMEVRPGRHFAADEFPVSDVGEGLGRAPMHGPPDHRHGQGQRGGCHDERKAYAFLRQAGPCPLATDLLDEPHVVQKDVASRIRVGRHRHPALLGRRRRLQERHHVGRHRVRQRVVLVLEVVRQRGVGDEGLRQVRALPVQLHVAEPLPVGLRSRNEDVQVHLAGRVAPLGLGEPAADDGVVAACRDRQRARALIELRGRRLRTDARRPVGEVVEPEHRAVVDLFRRASQDVEDRPLRDRAAEAQVVEPDRRRAVRHVDVQEELRARKVAEQRGLDVVRNRERQRVPARGQVPERHGNARGIQVHVVDVPGRARDGDGDLHVSPADDGRQKHVDLQDGPDGPDIRRAEQRAVDVDVVAPLQVGGAGARGRPGVVRRQRRPAAVRPGVVGIVEPEEARQHARHGEDRRVEVVELPLWPVTDATDRFLQRAERQAVFVIGRGIMSAALQTSGNERWAIARAALVSSLARREIGRVLIGTTRIVHLAEVLAMIPGH